MLEILFETLRAEPVRALVQQMIDAGNTKEDDTIEDDTINEERLRVWLRMGAEFCSGDDA